MAAHTKASVLARIRGDGVVPVFYDGDLEVSKEVAGRLVAGGLSILEFTNRGEDAIDIFAQLLSWARRQLPTLVIGVGSVIDASTAGRAIDIGADFVFAPSLSTDVSAVCNARNVPYIPGCGTVTEIQAAYALGCDMVKLFPAGSLGGPTFLSAVRAPCPWIQAVPTGGVEPTVDSIKEWFDAGAPAVGMGSKLLPARMIADRDWAGVEDKIALVVAATAQARSQA